MQVIDLFSGIGGFSLAAQWAGWETVQFCEINEYCQAVLRKNFSGVPIHNDVKTLSLETIKKGAYDPGKPSILVGGFPCQPYSTAGERRGNDDDRALWPEVIRILREVRPTWFVGENVDGLVSMDGGRVLEGILLDLEGAGYSWEVYAIPACGVGAPHRRYRVWIVAHNNDIGCERDGSSRGWREGLEDYDRAVTDGGMQYGALPVQQRRQEQAENADAGRSFADALYPSAQGQRRDGGNVLCEPESEGCCVGAEYSPCHSECTGLEGRERVQESACSAKPDWSEHWLEVAARLCRVDDGVSAGVDGVGELSAEQKTKKKNAGRRHRLEALGNAIVPQVVYEIFMAINEYEKTSPHIHP